MSDNRPRQLGRISRRFLLFLSEINLILGALFYIYPALVIDYWPWPVKALAVRFFGAIFLALAFGCWSALLARVWQRAKVLPLVGGIFFGITSLVTLGQLVTQTRTEIALAWTGYFLAASTGCFIILWHHGWYRRPQDRIRQESWMSARLFFRVQTVIVGVFGTLMLFMPDFAQGQFWPWKVAQPTVQAFAALFLATCLATGWASLQVERARIRVLLPLDAIFPALALLAVGIHWDVITSPTEGSPSSLATGVWVFVYTFVAIGSTYFFFASRKGPERQQGF